MQTILDLATRENLIKRIQGLSENSHAKWGKMNVYQMLKHCTMWEEMLLGRRQYRQSLIGRLFGKMALKNMLGDEPMKPGLPTVPSFKVTDTGDVEVAKSVWIDLILQHSDQNNIGFVHPFFGRLTADQAGVMAYKHIDHHLRQFNV